MCAVWGVGYVRVMMWWSVYGQQWAGQPVSPDAFDSAGNIKSTNSQSSASEKDCFHILHRQVYVRSGIFHVQQVLILIELVGRRSLAIASGLCPLINQKTERHRLMSLQFGWRHRTAVVRVWRCNSKWWKKVRMSRCWKQSKIYFKMKIDRLSWALSDQ